MLTEERKEMKELGISKLILTPLFFFTIILYPLFLNLQLRNLLLIR